MALIKYYNLESRSWEDVSALESNLQKELLSGKHIRGLLESADMKIAREEGSNKDNLSMLLYDSGDFDVLYKNSWKIPGGKRNWYFKKINLKIGTEMVVKADLEDILELQDYLAGSGFEVNQARNVNKANFGFRTIPSHSQANKNYKEMIQAFIEVQYPNLNLQLTVEDNVFWCDVKGSTCTGMIFGEVSEVLKVREVLKNGGYGIAVKTEAVSFLG